MTSRERVAAALRRTEPDRAPFTLGLCPAQLDALEAHTGSRDAHAFFGTDLAGAGPSYTGPVPDVSRYLPDLPEGTRIDHWGVAWTQSGFYHFLGMVHPMRDVRTVADIEAYPLPDLVGGSDWTGMADAVAAHHAAGKAVRVSASPLGGTILWPAYKLRGMEALLMDMAADPDLAAALLDRVTAIVTAYACALCRYDVDVLWLADDYGTQNGLLVSRSMWEEWFGTRLKALIDAVRAVKPDIIIAHHCDGDCTGILPGFIECGVDVLNPLQPECMDREWVKREYGAHLAFWGGVGTQTTLPFGTPADVRADVRRLVQTVGAGGGLLIAPTHTVEPEVPWDNLLALRDAVHEDAVYG